MLIRNNRGEVVGEINNSVTKNGDRAVTDMLFDRGNPVVRNI